MINKYIVLLMTAISINLVIYPQIFAETSEPQPPNIGSESAIILEANSGQILYGKNEKKEMYPASLTKIATAIYAIEKGNMEDIVTVSSNAVDVDGTTVFLEEGEQVPLKKLIQGMLINSGNDAAIAIAEHISGSVEQFSKDINNYLKEVINVKDTNLLNPHGLFDSAHITTAEDLARTIQYAIRNETFMDIFSTKELEWNGETWDTTIQTHHKLLKGEFPYEGITGGKNGFVNQSGYTLATTAKQGDLSLIVVTLNNTVKDGVYEDTIKLLDYGFDNFETAKLAKGTRFSMDNQEYILPETVSYTQLKGGQVKEKVVDGETLQLQDDFLTLTVPLKKVSTESEKKVKNTSVDSESGESVFSGLSWSTIFAVCLGVIILTFLIIRWKKRIQV